MKNEKILLMLSKLGMLSRRQIQRLCHTGSVRNTNYIMSDLSDYVDYIPHRYGRVYKLNQKGINLIGEGYLLKWGNVEHRLLRNDAYIYYKPTKWQPEIELKVGSVAVYPDALFYSGMTYKFLEVDRTQRWYKNVEKIEEYVELKETKALQQEYKHFPALIWIAEMESRISRIEALCKKKDLHCEVFSVKQIKGERTGIYV